VCRYNLDLLNSDFLELLERFIPSDYELKLIDNFEREGRPLLELSEEDRFMVAFSKIPRLSQRISTLTFMGNFSDSILLLKPVSIYMQYTLKNYFFAERLVEYVLQENTISVFLLKKSNLIQCHMQIIVINTPIFLST